MSTQSAASPCGSLQAVEASESFLPELADAARRIQASDHIEAVKLALLDICRGFSPRHAIRTHGADQRHLWLMARRYGIVDETSKQVRGRIARVGHLSGAGLEDALLTQDIDAKTLAIIHGIHVDKHIALERLGTSADAGGYAVAVSSLVSQLGPGESLSITVSRSERTAIDVTPSE